MQPLQTAWGNSLFEDNAEFGFGFRLSIDQHNTTAKLLLKNLAGEIGEDLVDGLLNAVQKDEAGILSRLQKAASAAEVRAIYAGQSYAKK